MYPSGINDKAVETFAAREREHFLQRNPAAAMALLKEVSARQGS